MSLALRLTLLGLIVLALFWAPHPRASTGPAIGRVSKGRGLPSRPLPRDVRRRALRSRRGRPTPYWKLERKYAAALKREGRLGAEVRRLRRRVRFRVVQASHLRRMLLHRSSSLEALQLASVVYDIPFSLLYRRASCESTGNAPTRPPSEQTLDPGAHNPSGASGLLQFLPSTFASTPFASLDIYSPYASALAGAWMERVGRGGEWVCQ